MSALRIPKHLQERVREAYHDEDGYWINLANGWIDVNWGTHTIHEDTWSEALKELRENTERECDGV